MLIIRMIIIIKRVNIFPKGSLIIIIIIIILL